MRRHVFALIDCNNFYVSCERAFNAAIQNKPVIVLSNNDGCVVARSNEVKKLGVKMGQPVFECQALIKQHGIQVFSSNYSLYADMSDRVMAILSTFSPRMEVYSIDEAFLELTDLCINDLTEFGRTIKSKLQQYTGIPVSVGIAPTKSLEKMQEAITTYAARAVEKLRDQDSLTSCLTIFIKTNPFQKNSEQYSNSFTMNIPHPTAFTPDILKYALEGLSVMYREGYRYYKAGVYLTKLSPQSSIQPDLFGEFSLSQHYKQAHLMAIVDAINKIYGRDTLIFAIQGITRSWKMRQLRLSSHFTTN